MYLANLDYLRLLATYNLGATWGYEVSHHILSHITLGLSERLPTLSEQFRYYLYNAQDGFGNWATRTFAMKQPGRLPGI